jgi:predicted nucleic acid-binding protein
VKLLDTTVAIDHQRGFPPAVALLRRILEDDNDELAASEVVRFELLAGVRDSERPALEQFFSALAWVPVDESVARTAGQLAQQHRRSHPGIEDSDYLIAATAIVFQADLLTTNIRHYPMLRGLQPPY